MGNQVEELWLCSSSQSVSLRIPTMRRTWTEQSRDEWVNRRTERRKRANRSDPRTPRDDSLEREEKNVRDALDKLTTKTFSWEVQYIPSVSVSPP